jgi:prolyl 4-hydroxylase
MAVLDQANRLAASGQGQAAVQLIVSAASADDPEALFALANWRLFGLHGERDLAEAHRLLDRGVRLGDVEATRLKATLIGNGTGCRANAEKQADLLRKIRSRDAYAKSQLAFAKKMTPERQAARLPSEVLCEDPPIRVVRGLFTPDECNYLIAHAEPALQPSFVVDPSTGARIPHPVRTSSGMSFGPTQEDRVVHLLNRRIAAITGTKVDWGEPLHMLKYEPGQEYRPHVDALPSVANQREQTVLVYLNDGYQGGATRFDLLGVEFRGRTGDALIFRNVDRNGGPEMKARHAGLPVTNGVKWLATRWIRQSHYHPWQSD